MMPGGLSEPVAVPVFKSVAIRLFFSQILRVIVNVDVEGFVIPEMRIRILLLGAIPLKFLINTMFGCRKLQLRELPDRGTRLLTP